MALVAILLEHRLNFLTKELKAGFRWIGRGCAESDANHHVERAPVHRVSRVLKRHGPPLNSSTNLAFGLNQASQKNGLFSFSSATVVSGPWPGQRRVSGG